MRIKTLLQTGLLSITSSTAIAGNAVDVFEGLPLVWAKVITIGTGPAWTSPGSKDTLYREGGRDTFIPKKKTNAIGAGEIVFALQRDLNPYFMGQIGIGLAGAGTARLRGTILVDGDKYQPYHVYRYRINHARITIHGKLLSGTNQDLYNPFISGSFGVGYNNSYHFQTARTVPFVPFQPGFKSNTESLAFAYTLGFGVQMNLSTHWKGGLGYQFADWGKSRLGRDYGKLYYGGSGIHLSNVATHQILATLSYTY